jgi:glycosyltransferase involved in cell wall biosynthesis
MTAAGERRTLLISENAPVPADRRVWSEARTLAASGWQVVVVCPRGPGRCAASYEVLEGIEINRFSLSAAAGGASSYVREYGEAMWRIARVVGRLSREQRFDVVHAANPPDFLLLAAWPLRRHGTRFIFDHHDLVPELYRSRFARDGGSLYRASCVFERLAFRLADVSIATNDSYRRIAVERGKMPPENVFVVRNGPDLERFGPTEADPALKRGRDHLVAYLGMMGPQDGIDHAVRTLALLRRRRDDWHAILVGDGDVLEEMRVLAASLGLEDVVEFAGWRDDDDICRILSTADVCLAPDPPSPLNDRSTMIKIAEYLAMGRAVASYDLPESRVTAGMAARFAIPGDPADLARCVDELLTDPRERVRLGRLGRERVEQRLAWQHSERELLRAYERALAQPSRARVGLHRSVLTGSPG